MSIAAPQILTKGELETRRYSIDFTSLMSTGETIVSIDDISQIKNCDNNEDLTFDNEEISGQTVEVDVSGGDKGTYKIVFVITTSSNQVLQGVGRLRIESS